MCGSLGKTFKQWHFQTVKTTRFPGLSIFCIHLNSKLGHFLMWLLPKVKNERNCIWGYLKFRNILASCIWSQTDLIRLSVVYGISLSTNLFKLWHLIHEERCLYRLTVFPLHLLNLLIIFLNSHTTSHKSLTEVEITVVEII